MISVRWHTSSAGPLQSHRGGRAAVTDPPHTNSRAGSVRRVASSVAAASARAAFAAAARGFCGGERARGWLPSALAPHGRSPTGVVIWNPAKLMLGCSVGGCHYLLLPVGTRRLSLVCSSSPSARHRSSCMRRSRHSCLSRSRESLPSPAWARRATQRASMLHSLWCEQRLFTPLAVNRCRASMLAVGAEGVGWWEGREGKRMCPRLAAGERVLRVRCVADSLHDVLRWGDVCMRCVCGDCHDDCHDDKHASPAPGHCCEA